MAVANCPHCTGALVEITASVKTADLKMRSCSVCDRRFWFLGEHRMGLDGVLASLNEQPGKLEFKRAS